MVFLVNGRQANGEFNTVRCNHLEVDSIEVGTPIVGSTYTVQSALNGNGAPASRFCSLQNWYQTATSNGALVTNGNPFDAWIAPHDGYLSNMTFLTTDVADVGHSVIINIGKASAPYTAYVNTNTPRVTVTDTYTNPGPAPYTYLEDNTRTMTFVRGDLIVVEWQHTPLHGNNIDGTMSIRVTPTSWPV